MKVSLLYGKLGLTAEFPASRTTVIRPRPVAPVLDEKTAVQAALRNPIGRRPLRELVRTEHTVAVVFSDITRPMPNARLMPILLEELSHVPDRQIILINGLGTHRPQTADELKVLLGSPTVARYRIEQHDCRDESNLVSLGRSSFGHEISVNRHYVESDIRILTGFIEPHLFAGFSGGPKSVLPGISGIESISANHGAMMIGDPGSGFCKTFGNPIWEEMLEVAERTEPTFVLNVTLDEGRRLTGVFAGRLRDAHEAGVSFVRETARLPVERLFEVVVSTAGGHPLDMSMYQSVKGFAVTSEIVSQGGAVILAAECEEGLPDYGGFSDVLRMADTPAKLLSMINRQGFSMQDQWDAQIFAGLCQRVHLHVYSDGLTDQEIRQCFGVRCSDIGQTVERLLHQFGPDARAAVLPAGSLTVPYLQPIDSPGIDS